VYTLLRPSNFSKCSHLQMRELGFDGYAIDFVDCPHAMRGFLMRECQLHRTVRPLSSLLRNLLKLRPGHSPSNQPSGPRSGDGSCLSDRRGKLHSWQNNEHGYAFAVRTAPPTEPHARCATGACTRRTHRYVYLLLSPRNLLPC
jgi:hypothetical protein